MLAEVFPAQGAGLAVRAVVGGDAQARVDEAQRLAQFGAGVVEVDLLDLGQAEADFPVDQPLVLGHGRRFGAEQGVAVAEGRERLLELWRAVIGAVAGHGLLAQVEQGVGGHQPGVVFGAFEGALQAGLGQVVGGGVGFDAVEPHGQHRPFVEAQTRGFGHVLADREVLAGFAHVT